MPRQTWRAGESLNGGGINIEINPPGGDGDGVALTAAQLASLVAADSALQPTDLLPTGTGEIATINGRALPSGTGGGGITMQQVNDAIDAIRTSAELLTFPTAGTFTGGGMGGGGDTITFNFARNGTIRSTAVGSGDAGRVYITLIEPTGVGDANDNVDWSIVQNYRLGNDVFTRSYTLDDATDDVAYARRDEIVTNRAVDTFDSQTYTTK